MSYEDIHGIRSSKRFACIAINELLAHHTLETRLDFIQRINNADTYAEISRVMHDVRNMC
jgi:hypothetical protein